MKVAFLASKDEKAQQALATMQKKYKSVNVDEANVIVALGGDGYMLSVMHSFLDTNKKIYGMNRGTIGFLLNEYLEDNLMERIEKSNNIIIHPLKGEVLTNDNKTKTIYGFNEVTVFRNVHSTIHLKIFVNNILRIEKLVADGVLVSTPSGSTGYNRACYGPILPLGSDLLVLTPIVPWSPLNWRGAILPDKVVVDIELLNSKVRLANATADTVTVNNISKIKISVDKTKYINMLFDKEHSLEDRILKEQF